MAAIAFEKINMKILKDISMMVWIRIFKTINEKIDDNDLLNEGADFKIDRSIVNIGLLNKYS